MGAGLRAGLLRGVAGLLRLGEEGARYRGSTLGDCLRKCNGTNTPTHQQVSEAGVLHAHVSVHHPEQTLQVDMQRPQNGQQVATAHTRPELQQLLALTGFCGQQQQTPCRGLIRR
jgi:hypothetical protein